MEDIAGDIKLVQKFDTQDEKSDNLVIKTLKERCYMLQRRLHAVEEENTKLSKQCAMFNNKNNAESDTDKLNGNLAQLTKEKMHLTQHVLMVACENKNLWKRISNLSSRDAKLAKEVPYITQASEQKDSVIKAVMPQLIRSQTFTQASPNPKLVAKCEEKGEDLEASLEEISLKILNSFIAEKSELVLQYEQMVELQKAADININTIGFTYLGDGSNHDSLAADIKQYTQKLMELKQTVLQQQDDLKSYLNNLEAKKLDEKLNQQCITKISVDLSKDTMGIDSPETEVLDSSTRWATPANSTSYHDNIDDSSCSQNTSKLLNIQNSNKTSKGKDEENLNSPSEKNQNQFICPLCGVQFKNTYSFEMFQKHVESHFMDDTHDSFEDENFVLPVQ